MPSAACRRAVSSRRDVVPPSVGSIAPSLDRLPFSTARSGIWSVEFQRAL
jgi:hypothetical protein